jgi:transposase InsO family protein
MRVSRSGFYGYLKRYQQGPVLDPSSDRGSQFVSPDVPKRLEQYVMRPGMSRKADCWDKAPTERFFRSLKSERLRLSLFETGKFEKRSS